MDRMHDADIDACTCHHLDYRLAVAERHRAEAQRAHDGVRTWTDAVIASVHAHPDGTAIMRRAAEACDTSHRAGAEKTRHRRPNERGNPEVARQSIHASPCRCRSNPTAENSSSSALATTPKHRSA